MDKKPRKDQVNKYVSRQVFRYIWTQFQKLGQGDYMLVGRNERGGADINLNPHVLRENDRVTVVSGRAGAIGGLEKDYREGVALEIHREYDFHENGVSGSLLALLVGQSIADMLDCQPALIGGRFKELVQKVVGAKFPRLRRSALRTAFETGIYGCRPMRTVPSYSRERLKRLLLLSDIMDTLLYEESCANDNVGSMTIYERTPRSLHDPLPVAT